MVCTAAHADGCRNPIHDLVVPLVEDGNSPIASGDVCQSEDPVCIALCERDVSAVRAAQAGVALGVTKLVARTRAVQPLIRRPAHACAGDVACHGLVARWRARAGTKYGALVIDKLRIGKADGNVVSRRSELLEVFRLVDLEESLMVLAAIQSVGLQPLLTARDPVSRRRGYDAVSSGRHAHHDRLSSERGESCTVRLVLWADGNHAGDARIAHRAVKSRLRICGNRARVSVRDRIHGSRQRVRQRLVELVVGHLSGRVARHAHQVHDGDVEPTQAGLVRRQCIGSATGIMFTVERMVVLEYEHREFGRVLELRLDSNIDAGDGR